MTAIPVIPSTLRTVSLHAAERYAERVDTSLDLRRSGDRQVAESALLRMYCESHVATEHELRRLHIKIDYLSTYYISQTSAGVFLMIVRDGWLVSLWEIEA